MFRHDKILDGRFSSQPESSKCIFEGFVRTATRERASLEHIRQAKPFEDADKTIDAVTPSEREDGKNKQARCHRSECHATETID